MKIWLCLICLFVLSLLPERSFCGSSPGLFLAEMNVSLGMKKTDFGKEYRDVLHSFHLPIRLNSLQHISHDQAGIFVPVLKTSSSTIPRNLALSASSTHIFV